MRFGLFAARRKKCYQRKEEQIRLVRCLDMDGPRLENQTRALLYVGERDASAAYHFMHDLRGRLANRVQLTTDGLMLYVPAAEGAFGSEIDYAQLVKIYGSETGPQDNAQIRYSPAQCMGARKAVIFPATLITRIFPPATPSGRTLPCECPCAGSLD
jgi:hypothetical protein